MLFLWSWNEFDHTVGCYITDYILGCILLLIGILSLYNILANKLSNLNHKIWTYITAIACVFMFIYSLLGGLVHQYFLSNEDQDKYTLVWTLGAVSGFLGFSLWGFSFWFIGFGVNKIAIFVMCILECIF